MYRTNYEFYKYESVDSEQAPLPDEILSPLATLYPHVTALQQQYTADGSTFPGFPHTGYWVAAYTTQPLEEPSFSGRRGNDHLPRRLISKLRRLFIGGNKKCFRQSEATD